MTFRAQCSNCMRVTTDPEIAASRSPERQKCPNCGERRLVVLEGGRGRAAPEPKEEAPQPVRKVPEAIRRHVASGLRRDLGWE